MKLDIFNFFLGKVLHPSKQSLSKSEDNVKQSCKSRYCNKIISLRKSCFSPCVLYVSFLSAVLGWKDLTNESNEIDISLEKNL